jgi:glyoxylase-like metal-dependent hydrolase (beta-lactamase superfamily II)
VFKVNYLKVGSCSHPECITIRGGSLKSKEFPSIVVSLEHPKEGVTLIDTGYSEEFVKKTRSFPERLYAWTTPVKWGSSDCLLEQLKGLGIDLDEVKRIILTHFHADHISGLSNFPKANFVSSKMAYQKLTSKKRFFQVQKGFLKNLLPGDFEKRSVWIESLNKISIAGRLSHFDDGYDLLGDGSLVII